MKNIDEKELHELFNKMRKDEQNSYEELYKKYYKLVYNIAFSILKNKENSEDISQNVFIKIGNLKKEKLPNSYEASWLYTVTKNECISFIRKNREVLTIDENLKENQKEDEIEKIIQNDSYEKLVENLEQIEKQIIFLKVEARYSFKEIARLLKMPIGTVQWKYYKSLHALKLLIENLSMFVIGVITCLFNNSRLKTSKVEQGENKIEDNKEQRNSEEDNRKQDNMQNENDNKNSINQESRAEDTSTENSNMIENIVQNELIENTVQEEQKIESSNITVDRTIFTNAIIYGLTSVFLCFSIFFTIIVVKNQQNKRKQASKK